MIPPEQEADVALLTLRASLRGLTDGVLITDPAGRVQWMSPLAEELTGCKEQDAQGRPVEEVYCLVGTDLENPVRSVLRDGKPVGLTKHLLVSSGLECHVADSASPIQDGDGAILGAVLTFRDRTNEQLLEEARSRQKARQSKQRDALVLLTATDSIEDLTQYLQRLTSSAAVAMDVARVSIWRFNEQRNAIECQELYELATDRHSQGLVLHSGDYPTYFQAITDSDLISADDAHLDSRTREFSESYLGTLGITSMLDAPTHLSRQIDGVLCCEHIGSKRHWTEDEKTFVLAMASLVSLALEGAARKRTEDELRESRNHYQAIADSLSVAVCRWRPDFTITYGNSQYVKTFTDGGLVVGRRWTDFVPPEMRAEIVSSKAALLRDLRTFTYEYEFLQQGEERRWYTWADVPIFDEAGEVVEFQSVGMDITDQKRLEAQFLQAQKMEAVGRLAGGVAHDFNNMLGVILGHTALLLDALGPESPLTEDLREIEVAAQRSADLTQQLLTFARKQTIAPRVLDLNAAITKTWRMLQRMVGESIELVWKPAVDLWPVSLDPSQIEQILANLVVNSRDACRGYGVITIETSSVKLDEDFCHKHPGAQPGFYALLRVGDNGSGMDDHTKAHIFEPFFTTKKVGVGTGLGMATVYGIVKQNRGYISVESEPGRGTKVFTYLPRHQGDSSQTTPAQQDSKPTTLPARQTVLMVEDELALLKLNQRVLERAGYTVLAASDPKDAIRLAREYQGPIHLLMSDVIMPGMSGYDVWVAVGAERPETKCLFVSGYPASEIAHHGVLNEGVTFLQKPFPPAALVTKVGELLASSCPG